jgi:hypothetical protein
MATLELTEAQLRPVRAWLRRYTFGLVVFGLTWLVLLVWWAAYFPGLFSPDSLAYIYQATLDHWNNHHSPLYEGLIWLSLYGTGGLETLIGLQTVAMAAGLGYTATMLRRLGAPGWLLLPLAVGLVAMPTIGTFTVTLWKDVGYAIPMLFAVGTLVRIVTLRLAGEPVRARLFVLLAFELTIVGLMRPNAFVVLIIFAVLGALLLRGARLRVAGVAVLAAAIALLANLVVLPAIGVQNVLADDQAETTYADISVLYAGHPELFTADDVALLQTAAPLSTWRIGYCPDLQPFLYNPGFHIDAANARRDDFTALWFQLLRRDPGAIIGARLCRSTVAWKPVKTSTADGLTGPPISGYQAYVSGGFLASPFAGAVYSKPLSNQLKVALYKFENRINKNWLVEAVTWRGSLWSYLTYVAVLIAWLRRRRVELLAIGALTAANQLALLLQVPSPVARYMFPNLITGVLLVAVAFLPRAKPVSTTATVDLAQPTLELKA